MKYLFFLMLILPSIVNAQLIKGKNPLDYYNWDIAAVDTIIGVRWDANSEDDLAGYKVYIDPHPHDSTSSATGVINVGLDTAVVVRVMNYCLTVIDSLHVSATAYDESGNESIPSDTIGTVAGQEFVLFGDNDRSGNVSVWDLEIILPTIGVRSTSNSWMPMYERYDWIPDGRHSLMDLEWTIENAGNRLE